MLQHGKNISVTSVLFQLNFLIPDDHPYTSGLLKRNVLPVYTTRAYRVLVFLRKMTFTFLTECQALKKLLPAVLQLKKASLKGKKK